MYLVILIYIGLISKLYIKNYFSSLNTYKVEYIIKFKLKDNYILKSIFSRVKKLIKYLLITYKKLYIFKIYFIINKIIKFFISITRRGR